MSSRSKSTIEEGPSVRSFVGGLRKGGKVHLRFQAPLVFSSRFSTPLSHDLKFARSRGKGEGGGGGGNRPTERRRSSAVTRISIPHVPFCLRFSL